ncbi:glutamine amidotransferase [Salibacterium sp. K-3]
MKLLLIGESWTKHTIHVKGFDSFTTSEYEEGAGWFLDAMKKAGIEVTYIRAHEIDETFPETDEALQQFDVVCLSDIGSNSLLLSANTFNDMKRSPNRLEMIRTFVENGGGFVMVGGYLSFQGIEAKGKFRGTVIEEILPVTLEIGDDRVETPEGKYPAVQNSAHPVLKGIPSSWPHFLGYNKLTADQNSDVLLSIGEARDPFVVTGTYHNGRTLAFASDMAPHWGPPAFVEWDHYETFWQQAVHWLARGN